MEVKKKRLGQEASEFDSPEIVKQACGLGIEGKKAFKNSTIHCFKI